MTVLNAADARTILLAHRNSVVNAMSGLTFHPSTWLPHTHDAIHGIDKDHSPNKATPISAQALAEYLAVATPTHCADGWSYLSRAIHSYFLGDAHSAWHFAYYAELRAAQSILSASGCGAFGAWNCILDAGGSIKMLHQHQTHVMVWLALKHLSGSAAAAAPDIASATQFCGFSLPDIVQFAYPGRLSSAISSNWISDWVFDLESSSEDKKFRNRCSYNPHLVTPHRADVRECVDLISSLWDSLQPSGGAAFLDVDRHIVRAALQRAARESFVLRFAMVPTVEEMKTELNLAYDQIVASAPNFSAIQREFITDSNAPEHPIIFHSRDSNPSPQTPRPALARAILLLRVATGMAQNLLRDAGKSRSIDFWLDELAEHQGIVSTRADIPADRSDLYSDCEVASQDLEIQFNNGNTNLASLLKSDHVKPHLVSQLERVVQWSFAA